MSMKEEADFNSRPIIVEYDFMHKRTAHPTITEGESLKFLKTSGKVNNACSSIDGKICCRARELVCCRKTGKDLP
jgi:hypothetical protein